MDHLRLSLRCSDKSDRIVGTGPTEDLELSAFERHRRQKEPFEFEVCEIPTHG
jgi:hypothetical protein